MDTRSNIEKAYNPEFTFNKETLRLSEIQTKKYLEAVSIRYLLKSNLLIVIIDFFLLSLKLKKESIREKRVTLTNPNILLHFAENGNHSITIFFPRKSEYDKIKHYDNTSIFKKEFNGKYKVCLELIDLKSVEWRKRM